jgi:hypothetical protein
MNNLYEIGTTEDPAKEEIKEWRLQLRKVPIEDCREYYDVAGVIQVEDKT